MMIIEMAKEQYFVKVNEFYDNLANALGFVVSDTTRYDCRKVCVAHNIQDEWFKFYEQLNVSPSELAMVLLCYGPKVNETLLDNTVSVEDGWITEA